MARFKSLIAIFLALTLLVSPTVSLLADVPGQYDSSGGGSANEGHPWDDEEVGSDPGAGGDPNTPGDTTPISSDLPSVNLPSSAMIGSGSQFVAQVIRSVIERWIQVSENKVVKSKPVSRIR